MSRGEVVHGFIITRKMIVALADYIVLNLKYLETVQLICFF